MISYSNIILKTLRESPPAPRVLSIVEALSRSAYLGIVMGQLLHTCWEKSRWRFFRHWLHCRFTRKMVEHILKTTSPKMCQKFMPKIFKKTEKIRVWRVFWEVWGPSWSHVEQAWPQKRKNAHQKSPNWPNLVASWGSSWSQNLSKFDLKASENQPQTRSFL